MAKLRRLPKLGRINASPRTRLPVADRVTREEPPQPVPPPFDSTWEVWLDKWLRERDPYWQPQVWFGEPFAFGSSRADWINPMLRIALYLDTPVHLIHGRIEQDKLQRALITATGYRVVAWFVTTLQELQANVGRWYARDIGK